jgi:hypothetical protein
MVMTKLIAKNYCDRDYYDGCTCRTLIEQNACRNWHGGNRETKIVSARNWPAPEPRWRWGGETGRSQVDYLYCPNCDCMWQSRDPDILLEAYHRHYYLEHTYKNWSA